MGEQVLERCRGPSEQPAIDVLHALSALHFEVSSKHEEMCQSYFRFMHMKHLGRKYHLARRSAILQGIPDFWAKTVYFLLLLGVWLSGRGGGSMAEAGACARVGSRWGGMFRCWVKAQDGCHRLLREVWSWAVAGSKGTAE